MKTKLYIDFDGVILDTITLSYQLLEKADLKTREEITRFYQTLDWSYLLENAPELNDSFNCIKGLIESNKFDISILTHVNSKNEEERKRELLSEKLPGLKVNCCPKVINKCDFVDPVNAILVDDYSGNLELWQQNGGISIKYSDNNKKNEQFITITSLDQLHHIDFNQEKPKRKARVINQI